jgi:hypothetical protein
MQLKTEKNLVAEQQPPEARTSTQSKGATICVMTQIPSIFSTTLNLLLTITPRTPVSSVMNSQHEASTTSQASGEKTASTARASTDASPPHSNHPPCCTPESAKEADTTLISNDETNPVGIALLGGDP